MDRFYISYFFPNKYILLCNFSLGYNKEDKLASETFICTIYK